MKVYGAAALVLLWPATVFASACRGGADHLFSIESYTATEVSRGLGREVRLEFALKNQMDRSVRMVDGVATFNDILGRRVLIAAIDPDTTLAPSETSVQTGIYDSTRLLTIRAEDIVAVACIYGLVYDNGEIFKASN